ncbi:MULTISPECIES: c-type cytochrome [Siphonobacter]|uniref:Cytochrome C n=1 Tax=Siphonobacter curvatus TaxID=2094562 RepID=A0A2S7IFG9_9BACT|nr:cytochrome c [Siphonobacter curvatus]PQA54054.1 cytochrome C [Siphonobacter curvatus]
MKKYLPFVWIAASLVVVLLASLKRDPQHQAWEFAPNMYYPVGYEPLSQIDANPINSATGKGNLNMRVPVKGTIPQQSFTTTLGDTTVSALERMDLIARNVPADSIAMSEAVLSNPIATTDKSLKQGELLYGRYCLHCHGGTGKGDGLVGKKYGGVPVYSSDALKNLNDGHIYHVITYGKGRMWPHGSQVSPEDRWKIVQYVHKLQQEP